MSKIDYEITVDVCNLSVEEKKKVQDAFFKLGIGWFNQNKNHRNLETPNLRCYTNTAGVVDRIVGGRLMLSTMDDLRPTHTPEQLYALADMNDVPEGMEPFDLERALSGDAVVTRTGWGVTRLVEFKDCIPPIVAAVNGTITTHLKDGTYFGSGDRRHEDDLFMLKKTHTVNGFEVPAPMREAPEKQQKYYVPYPAGIVFCDYFYWIADANDIRMLERGLAHSTPEAAIANAKAMIGIDPHKEE